MSKTIEEHMADFILSHKGDAFRNYRKRCLEYWRGIYGDKVAATVEKIVKERWNAKR